MPCYRPCKLLDLIQQELAERGDADTVLQAMTSLDRHASAPEAMLHHTAVADRSLSATDAAAPAEQAGLPVVHIAPEPKSVGKLQAVAATSLIDIHTTQLSDSAHASPKADPADDACRTGDSVLAAAMAAYRQEKRQLWKVSLPHHLRCMQSQSKLLCV